MTTYYSLLINFGKFLRLEYVLAKLVLILQDFPFPLHRAEELGGGDASSSVVGSGGVGGPVKKP